MSRIPGQRLRPFSETEKTCGAAVIDIGAQTTSIIVMAEGRVQFTDVRPWGAEIFTRDLAMVLGISLEEAEELKRNSGSAVCRRLLPVKLYSLNLTVRFHAFIPRICS